MPLGVNLKSREGNSQTGHRMWTNEMKKQIQIRSGIKILFNQVMQTKEKEKGNRLKEQR